VELTPREKILGGGWDSLSMYLGIKNGYKETKKKKTELSSQLVQRRLNMGLNGEANPLTAVRM